MLKIQNVEKKFSDKTILKDLSFEIADNQIVCIIGPSGCGKSTILNLICNIITPDNGTIEHEAHKISCVFQDDRLLPWKTVFENVHIVEPDGNKEYCFEILKKVGLNGFENYYPDKLSGGMKQRVSIARAFYYRGDLLLMDEPLKSLDYNLRFEMIRYIVDLWKFSNSSLLYITHEIDEALLLADKIIVLSEIPTHIEKTFNIKIPQINRNLNCDKLANIRAEIINLLTTKEN